MKAHALLGLALAMPAMAQAQDGKPPAEAARLAIEACDLHSRSTLQIVGKSSAQLDTKGLKYQLNAPEFLAQTKSTVLGIGEYVKSPSTEGEIWAVGYDSDGCMVVTLGAPVAEVEKGYLEYFGADKTWRTQRGAAGREGGRMLYYVSNPRRNLKLTATLNLRDADNTTTVTISTAQR